MKYLSYDVYVIMINIIELTKIANKLCSIRKEQKELLSMYAYISENKETLLDLNLENFYDELMDSKDNIKELYKQTKNHKDKPEIFLATQELLNGYIRVIEEITNIELDLIHKGDLKYAS